MKTPKLATEGKHKCDDCGKVWTDDQLEDIDRLSERLDAGGTVPSGECPGCGSLCYPVEDKAKKTIKRKELSRNIRHEIMEMLEQEAFNRSNQSTAFVDSSIPRSLIDSQMDKILLKLLP